jgi:hypothetical protein
MTATNFPESNCRHGPPPSLEESQCRTIDSYHGTVVGGSCDGLPVFVTAWRPSREELEALMAGHPVFLSFVSNALPPHFLSVDFHAATHPA